MADVDRYFQTGGTPGSLFFHQPREVHIESFDQKSPFKPSYTWLVSQPVPSGQQNRRRFVHSLATLDSQVMVDGGWLLPMGQEEAIRDLVAAYRSLPAIRFQPVGNRQASDAAQPVTFRSGTHGGRTYLYAVNDAPFATTARVHVEAGPACRIEELTRHAEDRAAEAGRRLGHVLGSAAGAVRSGGRAVVGAERAVLQSAGHLARRGRDRAGLADSPARRPGGRAAQSAAVGRGGQSGLRASGRPPTARFPTGPSPRADGVSIQLDKTQKHGGQQSVRIASTGPVACLVSRPFAAPATGRLSMAVWLRVADADRQPPLRLALEGKLHGRDYYRFAPVGLAAGAGQPADAHPDRMGRSTSSRSTTCRWKGSRRSACGST